MKDTPQQAAPFAHGALIYFSRGWTDVFPVGSDAHPLAKSPVPEGVTGYDAKPVGWERIKRGTTTRAGLRNLGIRMPRQVIGLDVDEYEDHTGAATLAAAEAELGPLPATWRNSSRGEGGSGHRYYRTGLGRVAIPGAEELLAKRFGPNIEILHYGRRYAVAWPSRNPAAGYAMYRWYGPWASEPAELPPRVIDLPELPPAWRDFLTAPIDSPAAQRTSGGNLRARGSAPGAATADPDDAFEDAAMTIRRSVAEARTLEQVQAVLTMRVGAVNKTVGGAGIWLARMANAGLITLDEARDVLVAAVAKNGKHSDAWNIANGRKWTLASRVDDALSQGLNRQPFTIIDDHPATNTYRQLMRKVSR